MPSGTIKQWFPKGGFGWIKRDHDKRPDVFVHIRHCATLFTPKLGQRVQFDIAFDDRNPRGRADNVRPCNADDADDATDEKVEWLKDLQGRHRGD